MAAGWRQRSGERSLRKLAFGQHPHGQRIEVEKLRFHLSFGQGTHNPGHGAAESPAEMTWLWRVYDLAKTTQAYEIDPAEKARPLFRVAIVSRDAR
jgi:hypothetical protein